MALCCLGRLSRTLECSLLDFKLWSWPTSECKPECYTLSPPCPTCAWHWQIADLHMYSCFYTLQTYDMWYIKSIVKYCKIVRAKAPHDLFFVQKAFQASCHLKNLHLSLSRKVVCCIHVIHGYCVVLYHTLLSQTWQWDLSYILCLFYFSNLWLYTDGKVFYISQ